MKDYNHGESSAVPLGNVPLGQNPSGILQALQVDNSGNLKTSVTGAGSGGTSSVDKTAFTVGTSAGTPMMGDVNPVDSPGTGNLAVVALDASRNLKVNVVAGGAGGGAVTVADGADVTQGVTTDAAVNTDASGTVNAHLRGALVNQRQMFALATPVRVDPVGTTTQPVSAAILPLPTGAATAAKQPALGTAGTPSADVITVQGAASMTKLLVTPDSVALPANQSVNVSQINGVTPLMGAGNGGTGSLRVNVASDQVAIPVSESGTWTVQPGNTPNTSPWLVSQTPATSGGLSISRTLSANNTTGINAKGSAGQVYGFVITNQNAATRYVKLYNKATAPTVGTDTPVMTLAIPGNANGAGMVAAEFVSGIAFGTGIGYGITTGVADADTGAPAANEVIVNLMYK